MLTFTPTPIAGVHIIDTDVRTDERGAFFRVYCHQEFSAAGLNATLVQSSISVNRTKGTLRGMHYQSAPHEEVKVVRALVGALFDVVIDLRPQSPTYCRWFGLELSQANRRALYIPEGCAHGFQTLADDTEVLYQMSAVYHAESARGVRHNDPVFNIQWPLSVTQINERDRSYPDYLVLS